MNVKRGLLATMVVLLVLCILIIVVSPYVDLPLTTVRACIGVLVLAQMLLFGGMPQEPPLSLMATRVSLSGPAPASPLPLAPLLPMLCAYLC